MDETPRRPKPPADPASAEGAAPAGKRRPIERRPAGATPVVEKPASVKSPAAKPPLPSSTTARPAGAKPAAAKPVAASAAAPKAVARKKAVTEEEDDFSSLAPRSAESTALPPRVVKKKKSAERTERKQRPPGSSWTAEPAEVLVPLILIGIGLALNILCGILLKENLSVGFSIGLRLGLVALSTVVTIGALFAAAAVLDLSYGYFNTAILKVAAICITQSWVAELSDLIPVPLLPWLISFGVTYTLFKFFFELDDMEAIASMAVVNLVHKALFWIAFAVFLTAALNGTPISLPFPDLEAAPEEMQVDQQDLEDDEFDEGAGMAPQGPDPEGPGVPPPGPGMAPQGPGNVPAGPGNDLDDGEAVDPD
jgi:hypothetical protein